MKFGLLAFTFLVFISVSVGYGQISIAEKSLRTLNADTVMGWNKGVVCALNLAQTSLKNWVSGGQNSISINGVFSGFANLKQGKSAWDNSLDLGFGLLKQGKDAGYRKTDDKFDFLSKYGRLAFKDFYYAGLVNFRTQFAPGYNYINASDKTKISNHFAPAYLLLALGLDYKPNANFSAFISPLTSKNTLVTDKVLYDAGAFGVPPGSRKRSEIGAYLRAIYTKNDFKGEFLKNVSFTTKIDLFSNYTDNPKNVDVNWETLIIMKVNKFISVSFNTNMLYDDNIKVPFDKNADGTITSGEVVGSKTQFKEILGAGFSYKF